MLLIYSHTITPRLQYIVDFFSQELFNESIDISSDLVRFKAETGPRINYSNEENGNEEFFIRPVRLLFEDNIRPQNVSCFEINFHKAFFETTGEFPFDIFAASFYLISRYEEYLPHTTDIYGRYAHINSLAYKEDFLRLPLINIWMDELKISLKKKFPSLIFRQKPFKCIITYDIDMAYSFLHKGFIRTVGGFARSMLKGRWSDVWERWRVIRRKQKDPFDCFEWLDALHLYCRLKPFYFFLVARSQTGYDKNISTGIKEFRELIEYYAKMYEVGIHPSWQSGDDNKLLNEEIEWLQVVAEKKVSASRQHYIRMTLPGTYRKLLQVGIEKDFSMGYGSINGFRASVCSSFNWYDLEFEKTTKLIINPFCFMDANSLYEQKLTPQKAYAELIQYYDLVKKVQGHLVLIWHNHLLGTGTQFEGWRTMFETFMKDTVYWDAYYDT